MYKGKGRIGQTKLLSDQAIMRMLYVIPSQLREELPFLQSEKTPLVICAPCKVKAARMPYGSPDYAMEAWAATGISLGSTDL